MSDFNIGPSVLHALLQPAKQTLHFSLINQKQPRRKCLEIPVVVPQVFLVLFAENPQRFLAGRDCRPAVPA